MLQNSQEISARTSWQLWWTCLLYCACHGKCIFADSLQMSHVCHHFWKCHKTLTFCSLLTRCTIPCACHARRHLNVKKWSEHVVVLTFWLRNVLRATTACTFSTSQLPKVLRTRQLFTLLTSKCASRHNDNGVHFFDIATSKSGPKLVCFVYFDFEMCFAPKRRAIFHLIWPDGSAPAALASLLFDPPKPQIIGKTQCFATFLPFRAPGSSFFGDFLFLIFFLLLFSSLTLPISAFHLSILSEVWLLNFLRQLQLHYNYITLHYTTTATTATLHYTTEQLQLQLQFHYITLHYNYNCSYNYTTLHYTTLHYTTYSTLHYNYCSCNYTTVHYTTRR